jgi:hypothetical protein
LSRRCQELACAILTGIPTVAASAARWADLLTVVLGPVGLVVSLAALGYAIVQIRKTKGSVEAAAHAADRTSRALVQNHLLFLIPEMTRLVAEAEVALQAGEALRANELLAHWRSSATRARGLLRARGDLNRSLAAGFTGAFGVITETRSQLRQAGVDAAAVAEPALRAIDNVMDEIGDLGGQLLGDPQGE